MKKVFLISSFFVFILFGCQENSSILEPTQQDQAISMDKAAYETTFESDSFLIDGAVGGVIKVTHKWLNASNKKSKLKAVLEIPKNAFEGQKVFSMIFNLDKNSVSLYPSPTSFNKPLLFTFKLKNVNVDYSDLVFKYLDGNESVTYEENIVEVSAGNLEVKKANLHHFSLYGWDR